LLVSLRLVNLGAAQGKHGVPGALSGSAP